MSSGKVFFAALILVLTFILLETAMAREEPPGKLIDTFTLNRDNPARTFFDGNLKVELISVTADDLMKTIKVRISSRALKAEFGDTWREHTYLEMLKHYLGDPVSGSPFKCAEGWLYYEHSEAGGVTLSLRSNPEMPDLSSYNFLLLVLENWKKVIMALGVIGLVIVLYYYGPFVWSFVSMQKLAHAHALKTGFPSSPLHIYLIKRLPLLLALYLFFHFFFDYGWKGLVLVAVLGIGLHLYFYWYNSQQLQSYASLKHLMPIAASKNRAFEGLIHGRPLALFVGGTFIRNPTYSGTYESGGPHFYISYLIIEVGLSNSQWDGLVLTRDHNKPKNWQVSPPESRNNYIDQALAGISRLPKYSILRFEVRENKLGTMKMFAPDTPAEIHLLVDLVLDVASALDRSHR